MVFWIFGWVHFFRVAPLEIWVVLARIIFSYRMKVLVFIRRFSNTAVSLKQLSAKSSLLCIPLLLILKCSYKKHSILVSRLGVLKKCSYFWLAAEALGQDVLIFNFFVRKRWKKNIFQLPSCAFLSKCSYFFLAAEPVGQDVLISRFSSNFGPPYPRCSYFEMFL